MAGNTVYVQGNYVDVHDNEIVNLSIDKATVVIGDETERKATPLTTNSDFMLIMQKAVEVQDGRPGPVEFHAPPVEKASVDVRQGGKGRIFALGVDIIRIIRNDVTGLSEPDKTDTAVSLDRFAVPVS